MNAKPIELPRRESRQNGGYWFPTASAIVVACPQCGHIADLDHDIDHSGYVTPSLACPYDCGFHDYVKLLDWETEEQQP